MTPSNIKKVSASPDNERDLIEACRKGDQKAQLQIYKMYYRPVYTICLQMVNDPATAEDIMHESFLSAFENIGSYCYESGFYSWINSFIKSENKNEKLN
jgi:DNA-directed RNA polymerase specialized sigma24 family protein